ncbi:hypothetical protein FQN51_004831 [Onygenales sp. PD_10]|nr:hypothetical protein FQN51_004831 [Onygenales sp. PD_10]
MVVFYQLSNMLHRQKRPESTVDDPTSPSIMACRQESGQQDTMASPKPVSQLTHRFSWPSKYLSATLPGSQKASKPAAASSSASHPPSPVTRPPKPASNTCKLPASVRRRHTIPDPDPVPKTPTKNTDIALPTIIHRSTPASSPFSFSSANRSPRSPSSSRPAKPILKNTPSTSHHVQGNNRHTARSDTAANTSRNTLLTLSDIAIPEHVSVRKERDSSHIRRHSVPSTTVLPLPVVVLGGLEGEGIQKPACDDGDGVGSVESEIEKGDNGSGPSTKEPKKAVRFDRVDVHPFIVERERERSQEAMLVEEFHVGRRRGGRGARGRESAGEIYDELELDIEEFVVHLPDVIEG